ncbi:MAG: trypsin-like peptidase domain-containing protein [Gemmatimonadota bacterium]
MTTGPEGADGATVAAPEVHPIPVIVFLSGSRRGTLLRLGGEHLHIGTDEANAIRIPMDTEPLPAPRHATLVRRGQTYELVAEPGAEIWVNGEQVEHLVLASGDVIEAGRDGAVLRFRLYDPDTEPYKSLPEVFADCMEGVRAETGMVRKATTLAVSVPRELATRTSRRFRAWMVVALVVLAGSTAILARRSYRLEQQLLEGISRVEGLSDLVTRAQEQSLGARELSELVEGFRSASERLEALEALNEAGSRVVAEAGRATVFLQGSYRFIEPGTDRPLRMILGPGGHPLTNAFGHPMLSLDGDGPPLEVFLTGTGFVVSADGVVVTNRHVALPWEVDDAAQGILRGGFQAVMTRMVAYYPGIPDPLDVAVGGTSEDADLAVLRPVEAPDDEGVPFLLLAPTPPSPGEEVIVVGYPLGLRALMARSDAAFVRTLRDEGVTDFWEQAERLSLAGFMAPLASRGIVGQVTAEKVAYDAETTSGGSGGPVLNLRGEVVAVNQAILPEFGGSNLGVPAALAQALLESVQDPEGDGSSADDL